MLTVDLALGFLALALIFGAGTLLCRPWWAPRPVTAPAYGLMVVALVAHLTWIAYWAHHVVGLACSALVLVGSIVVVCRARVWRSWRAFAPVLALTAGVGAACIGFTFLWSGADDPFLTAMNRFRGMPVDNYLQHMFADRLWKDESTTAFLAEWNGSDRPPLMSGLLLLARPLGPLLGVPQDADQYHLANMQLAFAMSMLSQLLWVPAVHCLVRCLRFSSRVAGLSVLFCAVTPVVFFNTTFTWPKLLAAALAVAAVALLADAILDDPPARRAPFVAAVVLTVLAFLSHGGVAFTVPVFLVLGIWVLRRIEPRRRLRAVAVAGGVAVLTYLPWQLYGAVADPTTNRLLKWHLAGVIPPTDESLSHVLVDAYAAKSTGELLDDRWANLKIIVEPQLAGRWSSDPGWVGRVREQDFYATGIALGLGALFVIALLVAAAVRVVRRRPLDRTERLSVVTVLACFLSIALWGLLMFIPGSAVVHVGSYAWLLLLLAIPFAHVAHRLPTVAMTAIGLSLLYAQLAYLAPSAALTGPLFSQVALMTLLGGALVSIAAVRAMTGADAGEAWRSDHRGGRRIAVRESATAGRAPAPAAGGGERSSANHDLTPRMTRGARPDGALTPPDQRERERS